MAELTGNLLVAQSGGPTAVINASLAGVLQEAGRHECIEEIYGGLNGIFGILNEDLIDINEEKAKTIEGLKYTPAAALGTCRYKIDFKKKPEKAAQDMDRLFEVFQAHNIRYFFYIGGNDSQDTSHKIHLEAIKRNWEMRVIGVPKTIDNDLPHTDSCPGYGSVIKYNAATVMEIGIDVGSDGDGRRVVLHCGGDGPGGGVDCGRHGAGAAFAVGAAAHHAAAGGDVPPGEVPGAGEGSGEGVRLLPRGGGRGFEERQRARSWGRTRAGSTRSATRCFPGRRTRWRRLWRASWEPRRAP